MMKVLGLLVRHFQRIPHRRVFVSVMVALSIVIITVVFLDWTETAYRQRAGMKSQHRSERTSSLDARGTEMDPTANRIAWEDPGPYHVAYPRNYSFIVDEPGACGGEDRAPFVVLMVPVAPNNPAARDAIRKTWGGLTLVQEKAVRTFFMLGLPGGGDAPQQQQRVQEESRTHRDLIQSDFMDTYHNLTIKTMVILDWLATRCPGASYAMKVDSDMFLNVQNLVSMLLTPGTPRENYMTGLVWRHSPVLRDPDNKFFLPEEVIAEAEYPPYALGLGYVMSMDLPGKILGVSAQIRPIYIEDAYLGMCLKRLGVSPADPPRADMFRVDPWLALGRCELSRVVAVTTGDVGQLLGYWEESRKPGAPCLW